MAFIPNIKIKNVFERVVTSRLTHCLALSATVVMASTVTFAAGLVAILLLRPVIKIKGDQKQAIQNYLASLKSNKN